MKYEFENKVGVRLAHRHTTLAESVRMIEGYENFQGMDALVTRPLEFTGDKNIYPLSWIRGQSGYEIFE